MFFFLKFDSCLHKLLSLAQFVCLFLFMQSFSALAVEIGLVEKTCQRVTSEGRCSCEYVSTSKLLKSNIQLEGSLKALSYLKSINLQPLSLESYQLNWNLRLNENNQAE